ncbi:hypothetical protein CERSUDRAFT_83035 [Gelatoporia subvermispora B]|uniref:Proteophosphoglycan ppg4 n=1 Tax=Ceriporiopsis subvermispora (strain B) TaxID=914234 RepID=M2PLN0_CERS8|nr:hypothetical protein CERSUDRAFT_83035 [Gelatoporia subvermispora B]
MAFGGVSAMLLGGHVTFSMAAAWHKVDLRSMFFATVFMIILLVLAYLTNPSETSFRTYLTEQSFRQHLSRLDENSTDESTDPEGSGVHYTLSRRTLPTTSKSRDFNTASPFHFVNRASVSLRTPKHVFYSFGIFTVAAVYPAGHPQSRSVVRSANGSMVSDSWFLGAFGKWWRGGVIQPWWREMLARTKDTERCTSGILTLRALDSLEGFDGLPFSTSTAPRLPASSQDSPPRLRGTERSAHRVNNSTSRSTTPPPLPKSASLPLHAPRAPTTPPKADKNNAHRHTHTHTPSAPSLAPSLSDQARLSTPHLLTYSASSSSLFDQSPVIAEILRQISLAKTNVHDVGAQLNDFLALAARSHAAIQGDLDAQRERKRAEDAARAELKTRTKALEDAKRGAEGTKRDAEKRLKAAETARDSASMRIERLDKEIGALQEKMKDDVEAVARAEADGEAAEKAMTEELELKKREIRVAEDVVAALNARAKELEERIAQEEDMLKHAREQAELRKQDRSFYPLHVVSAVNEEDPSIPWSPISAYTRSHQDSVSHLDGELSEMDMFPQATPVAASRRSSLSTGGGDLSVSPRPGNLSLGAISNFRDHTLTSGAEPVVQANGQVIMRRPGYPFFDDMSLPSRSTRFSPFSDEVEGGSPLSPRTTSLIPSSLINSLEGNGGFDGLSRSFQSEDDTVLARDWRKLYPPPMPVESPAAFSSSPTSITCPSFDAVDQDDPFEIRPPPVPRRLTADSAEMQHAQFPQPVRTTSDPQPVPQTRFLDNDASDKNSTAHRRWFSASPREKKALNPEAKVFHLNKKPSAPPFGAPAQPSPFDVLGALPAASTSSLSVSGVSGVLPPPPTTDADSLFSSISMRAFAPSRAEREALQRALGGSTNTSLERLPTLSEVTVASMPPSPNHVHAIAAQRSPPRTLADAASKTYLHPSLSWLQSFQRVRKPQFSPWDDDAGAEPKEHGEKH